MSYRAAVARIRAIPDLQKKFNFFITYDKNAEEKLTKTVSVSRPLGNLVAGIKDNIVTKDMPTTCGSAILNDYISPYDATCVQILRNCGAVIAGKTNLDEFGMGSGGVHSHFGPVINPLFPENKYVAGGSSSGSAAAVSAGAVDFTLGTDTGGSVRLPAAFNSVLGFKPSYGRISRHGVVAYAQSLDTVGILSKDISILRRVFDVLDQFDSKDPTSLSPELRNKTSKNIHKEKSYRIGIPKEFIQESTPSEVHSVFLSFVKKLMNSGHEIYPITVPSTKLALPIYYTLSPAEAASNLSRYDGIRYGARDENIDIDEGVMFAPTRAKFGTEVQNRIILGNYNLRSDSFKNNYVKAQTLRMKLIEDFDSVFRCPNVLTNSNGNKEGVDLIISLTASNFPTKIESFSDDLSPVNEYINDVFTMPLSLAGLPTISLPPEENLPIGIQLTGQYGDDNSVLNFAASLM